MIKAVFENGYSSTVYTIFIVLSFAGVYAFNFWYSDKYNITKKQSLITSTWILITTFAWIYILTWAETGFRNFGGKNLVRGFIYIPLFAYPIARLFKIEWKRMCDFLAPCASIAQSISKVGCTFVGCCHGYACDFGIYNPSMQKTAFPCQPIEGITYCGIACLVVYYSKRKKFNCDGLSFPLMLVLFGCARFLFEFARDNKKLIFGCSPLALHALFMAIVGYIAFVYITDKANKASRPKINRKKHKKRR